MNTNTTKKWVVSALFAALTCICTMIIKIPTPTGGYIHPGDGMVLLCGIVLGPGMGALAAGIGSMLSDLFSGYMVWVPATFIIKALTAMVAGVLFRKTSQLLSGNKAASTVRTILGGIIGEAIMVFGYFLFEIGLNAASNGGCHCRRHCILCSRYSRKHRTGCYRYRHCLCTASHLKPDPRCARVDSRWCKRICIKEHYLLHICSITAGSSENFRIAGTFFAISTGSVPKP